MSKPLPTDTFRIGTEAFYDAATTTSTSAVSICDTKKSIHEMLDAINKCRDAFVASLGGMADATEKAAIAFQPLLDMDIQVDRDPPICARFDLAVRETRPSFVFCDMDFSAIEAGIIMGMCRSARSRRFLRRCARRHVLRTVRQSY